MTDEEIRVGDRVRVHHCGSYRDGEVIRIKGPQKLCDISFGDDLNFYNVPQDQIKKTGIFGREFDGTGENNGFKAVNSGAHYGSVTIPVKVDLDGSYWEAYRAELAAKIAVAYAEKGRYEPREIGKIAADVANDVVWNLTKRSE